MEKEMLTVLCETRKNHPALVKMLPELLPVLQEPYYKTSGTNENVGGREGFPNANIYDDFL